VNHFAICPGIKDSLFLWLFPSEKRPDSRRRRRHLSTPPPFYKFSARLMMQGRHELRSKQPSAPEKAHRSSKIHHPQASPNNNAARANAIPPKCRLALPQRKGVKVCEKELVLRKLKNLKKKKSEVQILL